VKKINHDILHALAAFFMPAIPMLYLYARNADFLSFAQTAYVTAVMCVVSVVGFFAVRILCRSGFMGLIFCVMQWMLFFAYGSLYAWTALRHRFLLLLALLLLLGFTVLIHRITKKRKTQGLCAFIDLMVALLLVWNGVSLLSRTSYPAFGGADLCKAEFFVREDSPSPNVYWLHCDGMLGFEAMEQYFGDPQESFAGDLERRGFVINHAAKFEAAHSTAIAIPALMCPGYYDDYAAALIRTLRDLHQTELDGSKARTAFGADNLAKVRKSNELVGAFRQKGYSVVAIDPSYIYYPIALTVEEDNANDLLAVGQANELIELLCQTTMLSAGHVPLVTQLLQTFLGTPLPVSTPREIDAAKYIPSDEIRHTEEMLIVGLNGAFSAPSPRLVIGVMDVAHAPFVIDENGRGEKIPYAPYRMLDYAPQHRYAAKFLISVVDYILENDPDAVVVLQADHGLHGLKAQRIMDQFAGSEEAVWDIWNSTISAVRIPEEYGVLTEPLDPLNITRYLVNQYVGDNYAYLEPVAGH